MENSFFFFLNGENISRMYTLCFFNRNIPMLTVIDSTYSSIFHVSTCDVSPPFGISLITQDPRWSEGILGPLNPERRRLPRDLENTRIIWILEKQSTPEFQGVEKSVGKKWLAYCKKLSCIQYICLRIKTSRMKQIEGNNNFAHMIG